MVNGGFPQAPQRILINNIISAHDEHVSSLHARQSSVESTSHLMLPRILSDDDSNAARKRSNSLA
jgi:hypothetical protein